MCTCSNFQVFWSDIFIYKSVLYLQELCTLIIAQIAINICEISNLLCAQFFCHFFCQFFWHSLTNLICIRNPKIWRTVFHFFSQEFLRIPGNFVPINTKESRDFLGNILGNSWDFPRFPWTISHGYSYNKKLHSIQPLNHAIVSIIITVYYNAKHNNFFSLRKKLKKLSVIWISDISNYQKLLHKVVNIAK